MEIILNSCKYYKTRWAVVFNTQKTCYYVKSLRSKRPITPPFKKLRELHDHVGMSVLYSDIKADHVLFRLVKETVKHPATVLFQALVSGG